MLGVVNKNTLIGAAAAARCSAAANAQTPGTETQTIVVTATRYAMLATDAPAALSVITRRDIEAPTVCWRRCAAALGFVQAAPSTVHGFRG